MSSIRERILQRIVGVLTPVATSFGATLHRSPSVGIPREQSPALLVFPESESIAERANDRVTRQLVIRVVALARGDDAEAAADEILVAAHGALLADANLGGLCLGIRELDCEWEMEDADMTAAAIPARYEIGYRTRFDDLSVQG
ncbi:MAG: hypothetical protein ACREWE_08155 [Gammaproteobacteria bacterium]